DAFKANPQRGVFKTSDGGKTWRKVLYISDTVGAMDVELQPGNPNVVYAWMSHLERKPWTIISGGKDGGFYKSTDAGEHFTKITAGLPGDLIGKANLAVTAAKPDRVYALIEALPGAGFYQSADAGKTFTPMRTPHGDNHDIWINPRDGNTLIQSNDGGANVSFDGGRTWSSQMNQVTSEIYGVWMDEQFPYKIYGAQQDSSTVIISSAADPFNTADWRGGPGCETGPIMPHPKNPEIVYGLCKGQYGVMDLRTGQEKNYWIGG